MDRRTKIGRTKRRFGKKDEKSERKEKKEKGEQRERRKRRMDGGERTKLRRIGIE